MLTKRIIYEALHMPDLKISPTEETITFEFFLDAQYWDKPAEIEICIDDVSKFKGSLKKQKNHITVVHTFKLNTKHVLKLIRSGKTDDQVRILNGVVVDDQTLIIDKVVVDGVDIRNIVFSKSYTEPLYPEPWATEQKSNGIILEKYILGNTHFGHNAIWYLEFFNPFYLYIMDWMGGGK